MPIPETTNDALDDDNLTEIEELFQACADAQDRKDVEATAIAMARVMEAIAEEQNDEPDPWLELLREATAHENAARWQEAEDTYKRGIEIAKDEPHRAHQAYAHLSKLYDMLHRPEEALKAACASTEMARQLNMEIVVSSALLGEAGLHLKAADLDSARKLIDEAFSLIGEESLHDVNRSRALILRADHHFQAGACQATVEDLDAAWVLLEPWQSMSFAAGWQMGFARWWAVTARMRRSQGDSNGAVAALRESVARYRIMAQLPQLDGPYKHNGLAIALRDLGRTQHEAHDSLAPHSFRESASIRKSIGLAALDE